MTDLITEFLRKYDPEFENAGDTSRTILKELITGNKSQTLEEFAQRVSNRLDVRALREERRELGASPNISEYFFGGTQYNSQTQAHDRYMNDSRWIKYNKDVARHSILTTLLSEFLNASNSGRLESPFSKNR